jgi:hypothetical protein
LQTQNLPFRISEFDAHLAKIELFTAVLLKILELLDPEDKRHYGRSKSWYLQSKRLSNQKDFVLPIIY